MNAKKVFSSVLCGTLILSMFTQPPSKAATISDEGVVSSETDFDTSELYDSKLIVMIPDEVNLNLNSTNDKFVGTGFVTAWGKASPRTSLNIATDKEITYKHIRDNSITVDAGVTFGEGDTNVATWDSATLNSNKDAVVKSGYDVAVSANLSDINAIGTYKSTIQFNISVDKPEPFTYYLAYDYVDATSYTTDDSNMEYTLMPAGETAVELKAFGTDKTALEAAGHDKVVASSSKKLLIPSQVDNLPVIGVSLDSFYKNSEIASYVTSIVLPVTVEGIEFTDKTDSDATTIITIYNIRNSLKLSKNKPANVTLKLLKEKEEFTYSSTTYNGVEGYCINGLSEYGKKKILSNDAPEYTLRFPDTYNGKPVLTQSFGDNFKDVFKSNEYQNLDFDVTIVCNSNLKEFSGWSSIGLDLTTYPTKIKKIVFNEGIESIHDAAYDSPDADLSLQEINIPASAKSVSGFDGCKNLKTVTIADGFNGNLNLDNTGVKELTMPASCTKINLNYLHVPIIHFNCNSDEIETTDYNSSRDTYLDFLDTDYLGYISNDYAISATFDSNCNMIISDESDFTGLSVVSRRLGGYFSKWNKKLIIEEGVTKLTVDLKDIPVQLPSTMKDSAEGCNLYGCTLSGYTDFTGYTRVPYMGREYTNDNNTNAESIKLNVGQISCFNNGEPTITNLYIVNSGTISNRDDSLSMKNITNIYFTGSEEDFAPVINYFNSGNGSENCNIYYNQTF